MKKTIFTIAILLLITSCSKNQKARSFGGTEIISIPKDEEFINLTWKNYSIWVITKDTLSGEFIAREHSPYGVMEGKVIIRKAK